MSDHLDPPKAIDLSDPRGPMTLKDWAALYPKLPEGMISVCVSEASQGARGLHSDLDHNATIASLVSARLEELQASPSRV
jgi:hypothetical protein